MLHRMALWRNTKMWKIAGKPWGKSQWLRTYIDQGNKTPYFLGRHRQRLRLPEASYLAIIVIIKTATENVFLNYNAPTCHVTCIEVVFIYFSFGKQRKPPMYAPPFWLWAIASGCSGRPQWLQVFVKTVLKISIILSHHLCRKGISSTGRRTLDPR